MYEKTFVNHDLQIELTSFMIISRIFGLKVKILLLFLVILILIRRSGYMLKLKTAEVFPYKLREIVLAGVGLVF